MILFCKCCWILEITTLIVFLFTFLVEYILCKRDLESVFATIGIEFVVGSPVYISVMRLEKWKEDLGVDIVDLSHARQPE